jgi:hypothetical protein
LASQSAYYRRLSSRTRLADRQVIEDAAVRGDLGMMRQLGVIPAP